MQRARAQVGATNRGPASTCPWHEPHLSLCQGVGSVCVWVLVLCRTVVSYYTANSQTSSYFDAISTYQEEKAMSWELRILLPWWFTEKYVATKMLLFGVEHAGVEHLSRNSPDFGLSVRTQTPVQTELLSKPLCQACLGVRKQITSSASDSVRAES